MSFPRQKRMLDLSHLSTNGTNGATRHVNARNDGELKEKYYDPELNRREKDTRDVKSNRSPPNGGRSSAQSSTVIGPTLPSREDLQLQRGVVQTKHKLNIEQRIEDAEEAERIHQLERKVERRREKERLDELVPRADPGTRERQLEKRAEVRAAHRAFREKSPEATIPDETLMGGDDIKADLLRQKRIEAQREARQAENYRIREAERLKRRSDLEKREEGTMEMLRKMAQERYGGTKP